MPTKKIHDNAKENMEKTKNVLRLLHLFLGIILNLLSGHIYSLLESNFYLPYFTLHRMCLASFFA